MSVIDKVTSDFRSKLNAGLKFVEVPEWGEDGTPLKVYYKPVINFKSQEKINQLIVDGRTQEATCMILIIRAVDESGKNLFQEGHLENLMREADPEVVNRVVEAMIVENEDHATLKKT